MRLASSLSCSAGGGTLSRSLSSAGERHSEAYVPPSLAIPRRAETFAGFDHNKVSSLIFVVSIYKLIMGLIMYVIGTLSVEGYGRIEQQ